VHFVEINAKKPQLTLKFFSASHLIDDAIRKLIRLL